MSVRSDVTINWSTVPRVITVASPSTSITIQDLDDTLRYLEAQVQTLQFASIATASGKDVLSATANVGITFKLVNAQLAFAALSGPTYTQCTVSGGNLVAVDANGASINPIAPTAFTQVVIEQSASPTLITASVPTVQQIVDGVESDARHLTVGKFVALK